MNIPWTIYVKCQGPGCEKSAKVNRMGEVRAGWVILLTQVPEVDIRKNPIPGAEHGPVIQHSPFCGMTCLYNWVKARLPSKRGKKDEEAA